MGMYMTQFVRNARSNINWMRKILYKALGPSLTPLWDYITNSYNSMGNVIKNPGEIVKYFSDEYFRPLWTVFIYFGIVMVSVWLLRLFFTTSLKSSRWYQLATTDVLIYYQICTCAFGEVLIFKAYGHVAFFAIIVVNMTLCLLIHGKVTNIALAVEEYMTNVISYDDMLAVLMIYVGASVACMLSVVPLLIAANYYSGGNLKHDECLFPDSNQNVIIIFMMELFGGFIMRWIMIKIDNDLHPKRIYLLPIVYAVFFTSSQYVVGIPGHEISIALSRMPFCIAKANNTTVAIPTLFTYTVPLYLGWFIHSKLTPQPETFRSSWDALNDEERSEKSSDSSESGSGNGSVERRQNKKKNNNKKKNRGKKYR